MHTRGVGQLDGEPGPWAKRGAQKTGTIAVAEVGFRSAFSSISASGDNTGLRRLLFNSVSDRNTLFRRRNPLTGKRSLEINRCDGITGFVKALLLADDQLNGDLMWMRNSGHRLTLSSLSFLPLLLTFVTQVVRIYTS